MFNVIRQKSEKKFEFSGSHCLDNKLAVMTEEEEASTSPSAFTCFEHRISVELGAETRMQQYKRH
jgi:hypothetical protein